MTYEVPQQTENTTVHSYWEYYSEGKPGRLILANWHGCCNRPGIRGWFAVQFEHLEGSKYVSMDILHGSLASERMLKALATALSAARDESGRTVPDAIVLMSKAVDDLVFTDKVVFVTHHTTEESLLAKLQESVATGKEA